MDCDPGPQSLREASQVSLPNPNNHARVLGPLQSGDALILILGDDEPYAADLVGQAALQMRAHVWDWTVLAGLVSSHGGAAVPNTTDPAGALAHLAQHANPTLMVFRDLLPHVTEARTLRALRELVFHAERCGSSVVLIDHAADVPVSVAALGTSVVLMPPDGEEVERIVRDTLSEMNRSRPLTVDLRSSDFRALLRNLRGLGRRDIRRAVRELVAGDGKLTGEDIEGLLETKRQLLSGRGALEFVRAPTSLDEVGGLERLKGWLGERERSFEAKAAEFGLVPPRGMLLLGVQGAGKSLCAKAIATAWKRPLLRLDPGMLYDRFVGESEARLRRALAQAEAASPVVLWIDEIEKGFASAASQSTDGGLSQRMFGALLTWMQEHQSPVFLVATANNVEALPPELLRKGRFDEIFFVDLPGQAAREAIFRIHLKRRKRDPERFGLAELARLAAGFSGAEIEQAVMAGLHRAYARGREVEPGDVVRAIGETVPLSVTMAERIEWLRGWARERCVPAE